MGIFDKASDLLNKVGNKVDKAFDKLPSWAQTPAKLASMSGIGGTQGLMNSLFLNTKAREMGLVGTQGGEAFKAQDMWYSQPGFMFPEFAMAEFTPVEPMGEINVNALLEEMTGINRKATAGNFEIAQKMGKTVADNAFNDFTAFLDKILPEANDLTRSVARQAQAYINRGLPDAVMGNAILRDSAMFNATGTRGDVAVRRGLANDAARDSAGVQYGIGLAQQLVNDSRATALPFAQLGAEATQNNLGLLTNLTTISPAQRVGMAFDERNYQTGVAQFNASTAAGVSQFNAGQANSMAVSQAQLGMQQQQMNLEYQMYQDTLAQQQKAANDAKSAGLYSLLGTAAGIGASFLVPGGGTLAAAALGAGVGGGVGQMYGGYSTGNYGLMSQGVGSMAAGASSFSSWQSQQQNLQMQNTMMNLYQSQIDDARYRNDYLMQTRMSGGGTMLPASSRNPFNIG
jgi:hypothetical protein